MKKVRIHSAEVTVLPILSVVTRMRYGMHTGFPSSVEDEIDGVREFIWHVLSVSYPD